MGHASGYGTGQTVRGNNTSEQRFLDTTGGYSVTQRTYDIAGDAVTMKDPVRKTTTYGYNDDNSNHYALATSVKNALNQSVAMARHAMRSADVGGEFGDALALEHSLFAGGGRAQPGQPFGIVEGHRWSWRLGVEGLQGNVSWKTGLDR